MRILALPIVVMIAFGTVMYIGSQSPETALLTCAASRPMSAVQCDPKPEISFPEIRKTNALASVEQQQPVQPVEERGDAMLFEIEALHHMPFDQEVIVPFD